MTVQSADAFDVLRKMRMDLSNAQAKLTDALNILTALNLPDTPHEACVHCGMEARGPRALAEHLYNVHDGPEPAHYAERSAA